LGRLQGKHSLVKWMWGIEYENTVKGVNEREQKLRREEVLDENSSVALLQGLYQSTETDGSVGNASRSYCRSARFDHSREVTASLFRFMWLFQSLQRKYMIATSSGPRPRPATSFPIHPLILVQLDARKRALRRTSPGLFRMPSTMGGLLGWEGDLHEPD
jgi:hypothetical protein